MNPAAFHPDSKPPRAADQVDSAEPTPAELSMSFVEPGEEGILFSVICVVGSGLIYVAVLLFRFGLEMP